MCMCNDIAFDLEPIAPAKLTDYLAMNLSIAVDNLTKATSVKEYRELVLKVDEAIAAIPGTYTGDQDDCPLKHSFAKNLYRREIFMPAGKLIVSKIHRYDHFYEVVKGKCNVVTEKGIQHIEAPFSGFTSRGTKRMLYILENTVWITYHGTDKTTVEEAEADVFAKSFDEVPILEDKI